MNLLFWASVAAEAVLWYISLWYLLDTIRRYHGAPDQQRTPWLAALVLLTLIYLATVACPWVRETQAWDQIRQRITDDA